MSDAARPPMNALAIAMVKNEADVIEAFVRHNLHFVDLLVVIDNLSTDGTREILQALRREGLPLLVVDDPVFGHFQSEKVTHVYRKVAPVFQPELVYLLDADEFLRAPSRAALEAVLGGQPPGTIALLPWMTYLPNPDRPAEQALADPLGSMTRRRRREEPQYYKAVIRRRADDDDSLVIEQGNHSAHLKGGKPLPTVMVQGAALAHLPVRSVEQLSAKAINGWHACMVRNRHRNVPGEAYQWQALYQRIVQGHALDVETLADVALGYAQQARAGRSLAADAVEDPMPARYGVLRHLKLGRHTALAKVALSHEAYLRREDEADVSRGQALDLAPVSDLLSLLQARSLATTQAGRAWEAELQDLHPDLGAATDAGADLLLAPDLALADSLALAARFGGAVRLCMLSWPDRARSTDELRQELQAWAAQGMEPDLLQTMGVRALASYATLRHGAIVMRPAAKPIAGPRTLAVRELLCTMANTPHVWTDPAPRHIRYPLESLDLGAAARHQAVSH